MINDYLIMILTTFLKVIFIHLRLADPWGQNPLQTKTTAGENPWI